MFDLCYIILHECIYGLINTVSVNPSLNSGNTAMTYFDDDLKYVVITRTGVETLAIIPKTISENYVRVTP